MINLKNKVVDYCKKHSRGVVLGLVLVISGWFIINGLMQLPTISKNRTETAKIETKIEEEKNRQAEIEDLTEKVNTDEYIERIAGEKLGLVKSNATIFYDISEEN